MIDATSERSGTLSSVPLRSVSDPTTVYVENPSPTEWLMFGPWSLWVDNSPPLTVCPTVPGFFAQPNTNHVGNNLASKFPVGDIDGPAAKCQNTINCVGFNSLGMTKDAVHNPQPAAGVCLYARDPTHWHPGFTLVASSPVPPALGAAEDEIAPGDTDEVMGFRKVRGAWVLVAPHAATWVRPPSFPPTQSYLALAPNGTRLVFEYHPVQIGRTYRFSVLFAAPRTSLSRVHIVLEGDKREKLGTTIKEGTRTYTNVTAKTDHLRIFVENAQTEASAWLVIGGWMLSVEDP